MVIVEMIIFFVKNFVKREVVVCYVLKLSGVNSGVINLLIIVKKLFFILILNFDGFV